MYTTFVLEMLCYWRCFVIGDALLLEMLCHWRCFVIGDALLLEMLCYWTKLLKVERSMECIEHDRFIALVIIA